jgi:hypothetical protein
MADPSNPTAAIVEQIDDLVNEGNLSTRVGLRLIISVFREGMVIVGNMDSRMRELENAYVRFTNTMDGAKTAEEENRKALAEIVPTFRLVKWIGIAVGTLIIGLIWALLTGKADVAWR